MAAYIVIDIEVTDPIRYEDYKKMAPASIALYGGRYLARGGTTEVLEGEWSPKRLVILEFESIARAKEWLNSKEYEQGRKLRHQTTRTNMVAIEGLK